ncbi:MAG: hypothetical protein ACOY3P_22675 [Planctomycetota bacterium]
MARVTINRQDFREDRQGRTFADVLNDPAQPLDAVLEFFNDATRQRRMEESEIHHDRPPLAGVVRELESQPAIDGFLSSQPPHRTKRLRQAIGVVVRMLMERRGWRKTGKKGSLGVRAKATRGTSAALAPHNTGGLAFWFLRAERYEHPDRVVYRSVRGRARRLESAPSSQSPAEKEGRRSGRKIGFTTD